jgi:hypothetical protein
MLCGIIHPNQEVSNLFDNQPVIANSEDHHPPNITDANPGAGGGRTGVLERIQVKRIKPSGSPIDLLIMAMTGEGVGFHALSYYALAMVSGAA